MAEMKNLVNQVDVDDKNSVKSVNKNYRMM